MTTIKNVILGNGEEWCKLCLSEILDKENVSLCNSLFPVKRKISQKIAKLYFRINKIIKLPFKKLWYSKFCKNLRLNEKDNFNLIIYDWNRLGNDIKFLDYVKKHFPNVKLAYVFTNIVKITGAATNKFVDKLNLYYDTVFAFDETDAKKYNFFYLPLAYSENKVEAQTKRNDVFYVGRAKDRLNMLLETYEYLSDLGLCCDFNIFGVDSGEMKYTDEITYNKYMSYNEAIQRIKNSNCLIDIIQGDSTGLTIKTCEAIFYNKKLITTNKNLKNSIVYDERYMLVIDKSEDISLDFFKNNLEVNYSKKCRDYFSAERWLKKIENILNEKQKCI